MSRIDLQVWMQAVILNHPDEFIILSCALMRVHISVLLTLLNFRVTWNEKYSNYAWIRL
jgi:hypothetical protein